MDKYYFENCVGEEAGSNIVKKFNKNMQVFWKLPTYYVQV